MKKVLVTGADGFIGSHLTELLLKEGYYVRALCQYNSFNNWGWLEGVNHDYLEIKSGDIRDPFYCKEITKDIDIVFHLAALIAIPYSYSAPSSYIDTNVNGTLNICEAVRENGCRLLHTSTSEVYGTAQYVPINESHPKQAQSPYSASKIAADAIALSFYHSFNLPVSIVRPFNTYGPRQSARAVIPTLITQIAKGSKVIQVGDLSPTRDFNFVHDTCYGFINISKCPETIGKEINIASNYEVSIQKVLDIIQEILGKNVTIEVDENRIRPKNSEVQRLWGDNSLLYNLTAFKPTISIKEGLERTCHWFLDDRNTSKYKSSIYNV